ncbi:MAG: hypothetical protein JEZ06_08895 [Anaerolineaceae bacterium]|nr:hypothetical protein [Anaerolineaceae bacterium]
MNFLKKIEYKIFKIQAAMSQPEKEIRKIESGQGLVEYALIIALVVAGAIAIVKMAGVDLQALWQRARAAFAG